MLVKGDKRTFVHYGDTAFRSEMFLPVKNRPKHEKPFGGLWACDRDCDFGWKEWCAREGFRTEKLKKHFAFRLKEDSVILRLRNKKDFDQLPFLWNELRKEKLTPRFYPIIQCEYIDWEALKKSGVDAVEYTRTAYSHGMLYTWDVDSVVILNPDAVVPLPGEKEVERCS